tara:strand:+ start:492 stop:1241 length:750 start_codon:yes stop_codon:yes gene_type:complete
MILLFLLFVTVSGFTLNNYQYTTIINLVKTNNLSTNQREIIDKILFKSHLEYCEKRAINFKKNNYFLCKKISNDELKFYAKMGLYKAIKKYNGKSKFTYYSSLYIHYELINALTDAYSLSILPAYKRSRGKKNMTHEQTVYYNNMLNVNTLGDKDDFLKSSYLNIDTHKHYYNIYKNKKIWNFVDNMDPVLKKVFYLKYDTDFNILRNTKQIAELLKCKPENIRSIQKRIETEVSSWIIKDNEFSNLTF